MRTALALLLAAAGLRAKELRPGQLQKYSLRGLHFEVFLPVPAAARAPLPVLVFLHGRGESGGFAVTNAQSLPNLLATNATFKQSFPFLVVIPQCPRRCAEENGWLGSVQREIAAALREVVLGKWGGDPTRVYLAGQSMGGHGAWLFAAQQSRTFAAVVVICGYAQGAREERAIAERLARQRMPVAVYHSADDSVIPVEASDRMVRALHGSGGYGPSSSMLRVVRYEHAPGPPMAEFAHLTGHGSYELAFRDAGLYEWLLQQRCVPCAQAQRPGGAPGEAAASWRSLHEHAHLPAAQRGAG